MIRQFGLYPRFFVKKRNLLDPVINKYAAEPVTGKSKGQVMQIYFNLLRGNAEFKAEVDTLIKQEGSKLLTIQEKIAGKRATKQVKKATTNKTEPIVEPQTNFINAVDDVSTTDLNEATLEEFSSAVTYEEKQETTSNLLKIGGIILLIAGGFYVYKHYIK